MGIHKRERQIQLLLFGLLICISTGVIAGQKPTDFSLPNREAEASAGEIYFDGMNCTWVMYTNWAPTNVTFVERYTLVSGSTFSITSTTATRDVDGNTRNIIACPSGFFPVNSHDFTRLRTNISLGSVVQLSTMVVGDQQFTVTGQGSVSRMGHMFDCWRLTSSAGSFAYYDKISGLCVTSKIQIVGLPPTYWYYTNITATNVPLTANLYAPVLSIPGVSPASGTQTTMFNFTVLYTDADNNEPMYIRTSLNGTAYPMEKVNAADNNYVDGCLYQLYTPLQAGTYIRYFDCSDGDSTNSTLLAVGPTVTPENSQVPTLTNGQVVPARGLSGSSTFSFLVTYTDADNNAPVSIMATVNGSTSSMVPQDPFDINFLDGRVYIYSTTLATGTYVFHFNCSDGTNLGNLGPFEGPIAMLPPYFNNMRADYAFTSNYFGDGSWNVTETIMSGLIYNAALVSNNTLFNGETWTTNYNTRVFSTTIGYFMPSSHNPFWIPVNVSLGSIVRLSVMIAGDLPFTVTGEFMYNCPGKGIVNAWILEESSSGCVAIFEKSTGIMLNATFYILGMYQYAYSILSTNVPMETLRTYMTSGDMEPSIGSPTMDYNFTVTYVNLDNLAPTSITVYIDSVAFSMSQNVPSDTNYVDGAEFFYLKSTLVAGSHSYYFAGLADGENIRFPVTGSLTGPTVLAYEFSVLSEGVVSPNWSDELGNYEYTVVYQDTLNNTPSWVRVYIDGTYYTMIKDPLDDNFENGVLYSHINSTLNPGIHTYYFEAYNSTTIVRLPIVGSLTGPQVIRRDYTSGFSALPPTINGILSIGEWAGASAYSGVLGLESPMAPGTIIRSIPYTMYFMNDHVNLYVAIQLTGETYTISGNGDVLTLLFDNTLDGTINDHEQAFYIGTSSTPYFSTHDYYYDQILEDYELDTDDGGVENGSASLRHSNPIDGATGTYVFEMSMPYASTDNHDLQLRAGDEFGIKLMYVDFAALGIASAPYFGNMNEALDQSSYGHLTLAAGPMSTHPANMVVAENSTGNAITWQLSSPNSPGEYKVSMNGQIIQDWTAWPGNATDITIPVDTNIGRGIWTYTIEYNDSLYLGTPDSVSVLVNDIPRVSGGASINGTRIIQNATGITIDWSIADTYGGTGQFRVLINGASYVGWTTWMNGVNLATPVDTNRGLNTYNYTIEYRDAYNMNGTASSVLVTIHQPPTSSQPVDFTVLQNSTTSTITWQLFTRYAPGQYRVLRNTVQIRAWTIWPGNATGIVVPVNASIGFGSWTYTIQYNDSYGFSGISDSITIAVNDIPRITGSVSINNTVLLTNSTVSFNWVITDTIGGTGTYWILVNEAASTSSGWTTGASIPVTINTNAGIGDFNYTLRYRDSYSIYGIQSQVLVHVASAPSAVQPGDEVFLQNSTGKSITWFLRDREGTGHYRVTCGVNIIVDWQAWLNDTAIPVIINCNRTPGLYPYLIEFNNTHGFLTMDYVDVLIEDLPTCIVKSPDFSVIREMPDAPNVGFLLVDAIGTGNYTLFIDGVPVPGRVNSSWSNNTHVLIGVDMLLAPGIYNYTIVFCDGNGFQAQESVFVTMPATSNPLLDFFKSYWVFMAIGGAGIVIVVAAVSARKKRASKATKSRGNKTKRLPDSQPSLDLMLGSSPKTSKTVGKGAGTYSNAPAEPIVEPFTLGEPEPEQQSIEAQISNVEEVVPDPVSEEPIAANVVALSKDFYCRKCTKFYNIDNADLVSWYTCPTCGSMLDYIIACPICLKKMSLDKSLYDQIKKVGTNCPHCQQEISL